MTFRKGSIQDLAQLIDLAVRSWSEYQEILSPKYWNQLLENLTAKQTFIKLLRTAECLVCEYESKIVGMAFLVPKGNPSHIYEKQWCHLRMVSVDPAHRGNKIAERLTRRLIELALQNKEQIMALHTADRMSAARHIYEKIGFKILKEIAPINGLKYWLYTLELNSFKNQAASNDC